MRRPMLRGEMVLVLCMGLLLSGVMAMMPAVRAQSDGETQPVKELWFRTRVSRDSLSWFNTTARATDIASVDSRNLSLLDQITVGRKQALFASAAEAEQIVPSLAGKIDELCYDLEHWAQTPAAEQADPVAAVKRMRALADKYGLALMLGPDRRFTERYAAEMAPHVDIYLLQVQRLQDSPASLLSYLEPLVQQIRAANPKIEIVAQLRTDGTATDLMGMITSLAPYIDGVSLLLNAQTLPVAGDVVRQMDRGILVSVVEATAGAEPAAGGTLGPLSAATPPSGTLALTATPGTPAPDGTSGTVALAPNTRLSNPTPAALTAAGRRSTPIGLVLLAGVVGVLLGVGGLALAMRLRGRRAPAE